MSHCNLGERPLKLMRSIVEELNNDNTDFEELIENVDTLQLVLAELFSTGRVDPDDFSVEEASNIFYVYIREEDKEVSHCV